MPVSVSARSFFKKKNAVFAKRFCFCKSQVAIVVAIGSDFAILQKVFFLKCYKLSYICKIVLQK
jgi:hypothetical protein